MSDCVGSGCDAARSYHIPKEIIEEVRLSTICAAAFIPNAKFDNYAKTTTITSKMVSASYF